MKKLIKYLIIIIVLISMSSSMVIINANAITLEEKLELQNKELNESIDEKELIPDFHREQYEEVSSYSNGHAVDLTGIMMSWVKKFTIDGREAVIAVYALYVLIMLIYLGVFGSRDLSRRKRGIVSLIIISLVFLLYINIPLIMMYIQGDKSLIREVTFTDRINSMVMFLQRNSFIISAIIAYVGISKIVVSKNELAYRMQGSYLIKFSGLLFILLNTVPFLLKFLI